MSRRVAVVGIGSVPFRVRHPDKSFSKLGYDATKAVLEDANLSISDIDSAVYGCYNDLFHRQFMYDIIIHDHIGMILKPGTRVTTGGATGGYAIRTAYMEVASGLSDIVLCLGVEKSNDCWDPETEARTPELVKAISYSSDCTWVRPLGSYPAASYVLPVRAHIEKFGNPTEESMARVSVKNHGNAIGNNYAQSPMKITVEDVLKSRYISHPFKKLDCCLYSEGSAAMILASEEKAKKISKNSGKEPIWITGVGAGNDSNFGGLRENLWSLTSNVYASKQCYQMAGIIDPLKEIDVAELHDAFTGQEIISYEDCGFAKHGEGYKLIDEGVVLQGGEMPVNLSGGLIGTGHAVGATGIYQGSEVIRQLRGEALRQVPDAEVGFLHSVGGPVTAYCACITFGR
ncbi:MAG: thiolase family protein [Candidatus Helarchaeota archaeon]|nr:thiolase family protein [Candidatus Helarchaeota archaeon]